jgi:hypothetical protein
MQIKQQQLKDRAEELQIRREKHEMEKVQIIMEAKKVQDEMNENQIDRSIDLHKSELNYSADLARTLANLHKTIHTNSSSDQK